MNGRSLIALSGTIRGTGALILALTLGARFLARLAEPPARSLVELEEHVRSAPPSMVRGPIVIGLAALAASIAFSGLLFALRKRRDLVLMEQGAAGPTAGLLAEAGVALGLAFLGYFLGMAAMAGEDANVIVSFVALLAYPALLFLFVQRRVLVLSIDEAALFVCRLGSPLAFVRRVDLSGLRVRLHARDGEADIELEGAPLRGTVRGDLQPGGSPAVDELRGSLRAAGALVHG